VTYAPRRVALEEFNHFDLIIKVKSNNLININTSFYLRHEIISNILSQKPEFYNILFI